MVVAGCQLFGIWDDQDLELPTISISLIKINNEKNNNNNK